MKDVLIFRKKIADAVLHYNGTSVKATMSLGIACCIPDTDTRNDILIFQAETALYKAKNGGRNRVMTHGEELDAPPMLDNYRIFFSFMISQNHESRNEAAQNHPGLTGPPGVIIVLLSKG